MKFPGRTNFSAIIIFIPAIIGLVLLGNGFVTQASYGRNLPSPSLSGSIEAITEPPNWTVARLYFRDREHLDQVAGELDIWEVHKAEGYVLAAISPEQYHWLEVSGYRLEIDDEKTTLIQAPLASLNPQFYYFDEYFSNINDRYVINFLEEINANYPGLTQLIDIGDTWLANQAGEHQRDIWVLRITNENPIFGSIAEKPEFFLFAAIHSREVATPELAIRYIKYLTTGYADEGGYGIDPDVTWLVDHNVLYVLVMQNPDGHWVNEQDTEAFRRKNMDNDDGCDDFNSWGVDLNRNHSFLWGCCSGSSDIPCNETYRGPFAGSEPETLAFQNYFSTVVSDQNGLNGDNEIPTAAPLATTGIFISLHSYGDLVLWPWGIDDYGDSPNYEQLEKIGRKFAYFNDYDPSGTIWYDVDGATDDWTYGKFGVASFTFEVGPQSGTCGGFFPAYECIDGGSGAAENFWSDNKPAFLYAHKIARTPYITAYGPDTQEISVAPEQAPRGQSVQLTALIQDHRYGDDNLSPIFGAEYFIDTPGEDGQGIQLFPKDGSWGDLQEEVSTTLDTSNLDVSQHYILIHGQSDTGEWGPFSSIFLTITPPDYWVDLSPDTRSLQADPGQSVVYPDFLIENIGTRADNYTIILDSEWAANDPITIGPVESGGSATFDVSISIPITATDGEIDSAILKVQSQSDLSVSDTASLITTANFYTLTLSIDQTSIIGLAGAGVTYNLEITNQGNISDTFDLTIDGTWGVLNPVSIGPLEPDESVTFTVTVQIPVTALPGDSDLSTITIISRGYDAKSVTVELITIAGVTGPLIYPTEFTSYGNPGGDVEYTVTITNGGSVSDTFNINVLTTTWSVNAPNRTNIILPGDSQSIRVIVAIPEDAEIGSSDTANLEISSDQLYVIPAYTKIITIVNDPNAFDDHLYYLPITIKP